MYHPFTIHFLLVPSLYVILSSLSCLSHSFLIPSLLVLFLSYTPPCVFHSFPVLPVFLCPLPILSLQFRLFPTCLSSSYRFLSFLLYLGLSLILRSFLVCPSVNFLPWSVSPLTSLLGLSLLPSMPVLF